MIDAELSLLPGARPLADGARVRVHVASAEVLARVRLLGAGPLEPGEARLAQLRLEGPAVAGRGDRLVLRSYSPADTIGGAVVVDPLPPRRRRADGPAVERLREAATPLEAAEVMVAEAGPGGIEAAHLAARLTVPLARRGGRPDGERGRWWRSDRIPRSSCPAPPSLGSRKPLSPLSRPSTASSRSRPAMPREELRARAFGGAPVPVFERVLADLAAAGRVRLAPDAVAATRHEVRLSAERGGGAPACSWTPRGRRGSPASRSRPWRSIRGGTRGSWSGSCACW